MSIFKSLISRVIILNILLVTVGIGTFTLYNLRREQNQLVSSTKESAALLLATIENSIFHSMRIGNSEDVQAILEMVGYSHQLTGIRIFHPDGTILKSARPHEIGTKVNSFDLALFHNELKEGIIRVDGEEVLTIIKPIVTDPRCDLCHGPGRKVVGVLDLNFSLADTTRQLHQLSQFSLLSTVLITLFLSLGISFILLRFVKRPIQAMARKMEQVEQGDLSVRLQPQTLDEMGSLMRSFNSMVVNLEKAKKDLEQYHYRQMERADRLASIGEMATGIAHEIKNPLTCISSAITVLADDFEEEDPRREVIGQVLDQIGRLDKTSTDLLFFGKPGKPECTYTDINELLNKTLFFISQHPEARNIHRVKELIRDIPPVLIDEKQVQQVLFNIIINAIQSMRDGGTLTVTTDKASHEDRTFIRLTITDTGHGISEENLSKIFTPFFTTKTQGTGLGLPICRQLLEQNGGTLDVESRINEGTTFIIELPASGPLPNASEEPRA